METTYSINELRTVIYNNGAKFDNLSEFFLQADNDFANTVNPIEKFLLKRELDRAINLASISIPSISAAFDEAFWQTRFNSLIDLVYTYFDKTIEKPNLYLVDGLTGVGQGKRWDAMSLDALDEKRTGNKKGIYFKFTSINQPYFDFTIVHELIHWIISCYSKQYFPFTSLLEEGICDYFSYYFLLKHNPKDFKTVTNLMTFLRVLKKENTTIKNYYRFSKLISTCVTNNGFDYIINIIKSGREAVNSFSLTLKENCPSNDETIMMLNACLSSAEASVVLDPTEYYLLEIIFKDKLNDFQEDDFQVDNFNQNQIRQSLKKLFDLNLLSYSNNRYYQSLINFPSNIRFKIVEAENK